MYVCRKDEWQGVVIKTSRQDVGGRKRKWSWFKVPEGQRHIHMVCTDKIVSCPQYEQ